MPTSTFVEIFPTPISTSTSISTFPSSPTSSPTPAPAITKLEPLQSSVLLADLIPAVLVLIYLLLASWKLYLLLRRYASWRGTKAGFVRCVRGIGLWGCRVRGTGRERGGYVRVWQDFERGYVEQENRHYGDGVDEDEVEVEVDFIEMQTRAQMTRARLLNASGLVPVRDDSPAPINDESGATTVTTRIETSLTPPSRRCRKRPPPLILKPYLPANFIRDNSYTPPPTTEAMLIAQELNISRYFDRETGLLKDYIIRNPATGLEELCETIPRPDKGCGGMGWKVWMEWVVDRLVASAQGWFEGMDPRVYASREGLYQAVPGDDDCDDGQ